MELFKASFVYFLAILAIVLLCIAQRNGRDDQIPQVALPWREGTMWEVLVYMSLWALIVSLVFAGLVDVIVWASKSESPSVSDLVHYHLQQYPWIGWVVAGLVYHLLVDRPAPPWR